MTCGRRGPRAILPVVAALSLAVTAAVGSELPATATSSTATSTPVGGGSADPPASVISARRAPTTTDRSRGIDPALRTATGQVAVMIELDQAPAATAYAAQLRHGRGHHAATTAFRAQSRAVQATERTLRRALARPATRAQLIFSTTDLYSGLAVTTTASRLSALAALPGVKAIRALSPKSPSSQSSAASAAATAATFFTDSVVGAQQVWQARDTIGTGVTIGVIDTGVDYTHNDFGGAGTTAAYNAALASDTAAPSYPDPAKVSGGYDFAGDAYNATPSAYVAPTEDSNPLDCNGHGTHVAGTAAGLGENSNGSTYTGPYDTTLPPSMRIEPGVAPGATIVPLKVFGCADGDTTDLVSEALEWAATQGTGDPSQHLDVVNLSLGSSYSSPQDPDAVAADNAAAMGIVVVAAAGNGGDVYDAGGSPGNAPDAIAVAATDSANTIAPFSARGIRGAGNAKPDIAAPGVAITSAYWGKGNQARVMDGTSMATPHVAGAAALVRETFPSWSVAQIKTALMDTASGGNTVTVGSGSSATTATAPPMRTGAGLVQADEAMSTSVLAYSATEPDAVSLSFGPVPATTATLTVTKMLRVQSLRNTATSYSLAFQSASMPAGVTITVGARVVALAAGQSVDVPVTLTVNPAAMKLTPDPTKTMSGSDWDTWIAEASGWVALTSRDGTSADLRVPVYAAPRRASSMAAATSATVTSSTIGTGTLALSGNGFGSGASSAPDTYASLLTATQLQATSPKMPSCSSTVITGCIPFSDDSAADIRYVGTSSDVPYCSHGSHGIDTCVDSTNHTYAALLNVAVATWGAWRTPASFAQFYVWWDVNGDGTPDALTLNTRLSDSCPGDPTNDCDTDQLVAQTYLPCPAQNDTCALVVGGSSGTSYWQESSIDEQPLNTIGGELDTSPYDSNVVVLPVALNSLERAGWDSSLTPHVHYWVTTSSVESAAGSVNGTIDSVASSTAPLAVTVASPALGAVGDLGLPELNSDRAGTAYSLKLRENSAALLFDLPATTTPSLLLIHHDNLNSSRAQVVPVKRAATISISLSSTSIKTTTHAKVTVTVSPTAATGTVSCRDGSTTLVTVSLSAGKATCTLPTLKKGSHAITAVYGGSVSYAAKTSASVTVKVS